MQVAPGTPLLHYRLIDKVGEGGMGVVWRALDTTLDRQVAIKILPDVFASDPDRAARFEREAKVLASLNHPNITSVHSVHHVDGVRFLVMEFAQGENLADRIVRGPLPLDEALVIAKQISLAIEAAHETGVVHRDLKPANIRVTTDNKVEVLDFGLAKALDAIAGGTASDLSKSPTIVSGHTAAGLILGTAAYMSPEQARGKSVDRRTDIWSFGCVLFEMLSGRRAFDGETVTDVLAAVVTRDPDWSLIPAHTPARIRELLRRCLEKDAQRRLRDAGEIRIAVEDAIARPQSGAMEAAAPVAAAGPRHERRRVWPWIVLAAMAFIVVMTLIDDDDAPRTPPTRLSVVLAPTDLLDGGSENLMLNISRDGRTVAYAARRDANTALFVRHFGDGEATRLTGTEDAHSPFFSPDGKWIAFVAQSKLRKVSVGGGPVFDICDVSVDRSGVWLDDGSIIVSTHATVPLMRVSSSGGALQAVTALDTANGERTHRWPDALPGSEWVIFTVGAANSPGNYEDAAIDAASLRTGERRRLVERASMARYCEPGYLVFSRRGALFAARIDPSDPKLTGPSVPILDRVDREPSSGAVHFAVARNGTLVFAPRLEASDHFEMVWITHDGATTLIPAPPNEYSSPRISPDGRQICVVIGHAYGQGDLWRLDLARETLTRLTFDATNVVGYWTPDGRHIVYQSENVAFNVSILPLDGDAGEKRIFSEKQPHMITGLTPDGRTVLMAPWGKSDGDILSLPIEGGEPRVVVKEPFDQADAVVSPDGKWIAYDSRATGTLEVFVRSYPPGESRWQISSGGGMMPAWSPTRRELYWIQNNAIFAAVYVAGDRTISFDRAHKLFDMPPRRDADVNPYDISPDGSRFLMTRTARPEFARRRIDVVLGFDAMLRDLNRKTAVE